MKITPEQLPILLSKNRYPILLISGNETLLLEETIDSVRKHYEQDRISFSVDSHFNWISVIEAARNHSLFSESRLIELRFSTNKIGEPGQTELMKYLEHPGTHVTFLIIMPQLDASALRTTWFKTIDQLGLFIPVWPITSKQLPYWLQKRLNHLKLKMNREAVTLLCESVEGNLLAAKQAIDKLQMTFPDKKEFTQEDVAFVMSNHAHFDIFALSQAALEGDLKRVLRILPNLQAQGVEPTLILWAIVRDLRLLIQYSHNPSLPRIHEKQIPAFKSSLSRHNDTSLKALLYQASEIDPIIKGIHPGNVWNEFKQLCVRLCGIKFSTRQ